MEKSVADFRRNGSFFACAKKADEEENAVYGLVQSPSNSKKLFARLLLMTIRVD